MSVKALTSFGCNIYKEHGTNHFVEFREGDIITDPEIIAVLVTSNAPIADVNDPHMVSCPQCRTVFDSRAFPIQATITRVNCAIPYNSQFYKWTAGEVVPYPWLADALKTAGIPLTTIDAFRCPKCETISY